MGTNMVAGNQQVHLSLSFATKALIYLSRNLKTLKWYFSQYKNRSDSQISWNKSRNKSLFNQLGCHVNAMSHKSLETQVVYCKTKNPIRTNICVNISFQLLLYLIKVKYQQDKYFCSLNFSDVSWKPAIDLHRKRNSSNNGYFPLKITWHVTWPVRSTNSTLKCSGRQNLHVTVFAKSAGSTAIYTFRNIT